MRRAAALGLILAVAAAAYTRGTVEGSLGGTPLYWATADGPRFRLAETVVADLRNADNRPVIAPGSDPVGALQAALDAWSGAPGSALGLGTLERAAATLDPFDGRNSIVFDDTAAIRALTDGALGVTVVTAQTNGKIVDADIVFNPNLRIGNNQAPYSTTGALNSIDLQDVATHLIGRAVGAGSSGVIAAAMFPKADPSQSFRTQLSSDDLAFLAEAYPAAGEAARRGAIVGTVSASLTGTPLTGVLVTAIDPSTGMTVQTVTSLTDGTYRISAPAVPVGRYYVYAEPLDGPVIPPEVQLIDLSGFRTDVRVEFFGGNAVPTRLSVPPGRTLRADISVQTGASALRIEKLGVGPAGASGAPERFSAGPIAVPAGQDRDVLLLGLGIDGGVKEEEIQLLGPGVRVKPGSVRVDPVFNDRGAPVVRFTLESDARTERALATLLLMRNRAAEVFTGAIVLEPAPAFSAGQVVNAASFEAGAVAPGGIASIFGASLGPAQSAENTSFDAATGLLGTELGGVRVLFDGVAAPLFFVSAGQINLQVPFEVTGQSETVVQIERDGVAGLPVSVPVETASPGVFTFADGVRAVALNQDGSLNGPSLPAFAGEIVTLYATGQGLVAPALRTGEPAKANPLSRSTAPTITIGGVTLAASDVFFSGMTPGLVGLLQLNVRIPQGAATGDDVAVTVSFDGFASKTVRMSLR
ncbi:MAG: hypothetical protein KDC27_00300 [Acidobacteria bacterium]|nr:hypothetical protein [Acidobacteriota bacterium]